VAKGETAVSAAHAVKKEKAATLARAATSFVMAWHEHEAAKANAQELFEEAWNTRHLPAHFKNMEDLVTRARAFAVKAHGTQMRKYEKVPYVTHLDRVVALLKEHGFDAPHLLAAAYLHDTLEDTEASLQDMVAEFGAEVAELVYWLSDLEKGTRQTRKRMSAWRLSRAPLEAKLIKLADLADNTPSIIQHDPDFAKVYLAEKELILSEMVRVEGDKITGLQLFKIASSAAK
jgi:(p)ppGpp synthase/HD superfamily hydrolase